jgi:hypothetical protein
VLLTSANIPTQAKRRLEWATLFLVISLAAGKSTARVTRSAAPTSLGSSWGLISQPFRAGLTFGGRPLRQAQGRLSGPRLWGDSCLCHFSLKLPQARWLLGMTK